MEWLSRLYFGAEEVKKAYAILAAIVAGTLGANGLQHMSRRVTELRAGRVPQVYFSERCS